MILRSKKIRGHSQKNCQITSQTGFSKTLHEKDSFMMMGGGKGNDPLVFNDGGKPYRGFLEGRINDKSYCLILHLSNQELKGI